MLTHKEELTMQTPSLWRLPRVLDCTGQSRALFLKNVQQKRAPQPVRIGGSRRAVAWVSDEIAAYIREQIEARDGTNPSQHSAA